MTFRCTRGSSPTTGSVSTRARKSKTAGIAAKAGERRRGAERAAADAADAARWRGLEAALRGEGRRVAPAARESGVGRAAAAVGQRARTTGFTPISRCGHLARCPPGSASTSSARRTATPSARSLKLVGLAIRPGIRDVTPLPRCIHTYTRIHNRRTGARAHTRTYTYTARPIRVVVCAPSSRRRVRNRARHSCVCLNPGTRDMKEREEERRRCKSA